MIFLVFVPVAFSNYPAALYLLERSDPHGLPAWSAWLAPLVALGFGMLALYFWQIGVRKYSSTGS